MRRPEENQARTARPSLLSTSSEGDTAHNRILANFENGIDGQAELVKSSRAFLKHRLLLAATLASVAVVVAGVVCLSAWPPFRMPIPPTTRLPQPLPDASGNSSLHAAASGLQPGPLPGRQVAAVLNDPVEYRDMTVRSAAGTGIDSASLERSPEKRSAISGTGDNVKQADNASSSLANRAAANENNRSDVAASLASNSSRPGRKMSSHDRTSVKKASRTPKENADRDVTLLAALIAHNSEKQADRPGGVKHNEPRSSNKSSQQPGKSSPSRGSKASRPLENEQGRAVVERAATESSDKLLQHCGQLSFIEGQLCRWRTCSGRWDSDAACKASAGRS